MRANDNELLRRYLRDQSETAFTELVERYIGLVYSAALRQVAGDPQAAEDITQAVFVDLSRKAGRLLRHPTLTGWLYTSTRYLAANHRRVVLRRRLQEQSAQVMNDLLRDDVPEQDWSALRPVLDEAMHDLPPADREAVLWRYFEKHPFAEIGLRLGLSENSARMRVERALDKLRLALARRGVTSSLTALAFLVSSRAIGSVPPGLAARVGRTALAAGAAGGSVALVAIWLAALKGKVALGLLAVVAVMVLLSGHRFSAARQASANEPAAATPREQGAQSSENELTNALVGAPELVPMDVADNQPKFELRLVAADTGEPVTDAKVRYFWDTGSRSEFEYYRSDSSGRVEVACSPKLTSVEFVTEVEGFADTLLCWRPARGDAIPSQYVLRLARAASLGGWVMGPDGQPVAESTVEGSYPTDTFSESQRETQLGTFKAKTDAQGHWASSRVSSELVRPLSLHASHPEFGPSESVNVSYDPDIERRLREGTFTMRLKAATWLRGFVVDPEGHPVAGAKVLLGRLYSRDAKDARTSADGSFQFSGVPFGKNLLTASAEGFATTTIQTEMRSESEPIRLVISRGKPLHIRLLDFAGNPVSDASVWVSARQQGTGFESDVNPELSLNGKTDSEGRVFFAHVPDTTVEVGATAPGYMELCGFPVQPGGPECTLSLEPELVVTGTVRDAATGQPVPRFKLITGRPEPQGPYWSTIGRFHLSFEGGTFQHTYSESVVREPTNSGYVLRFEAEGYAPFISRFIAANERLVQLDVRLQASKPLQLTVLNPDGNPASFADVGLPDLARDNALPLVPGGFGRRYARSDNALLRTDERGLVKCPGDSGRRLVAASPAGYAEVEISELADAVVRLQPWGRVEGILPMAEDDPGSPEVLFRYHGDRDRTGILADFFSTFRIKPDRNGQFVFPLVPPGCHDIVELVPESVPEPRRFHHARTAKVEVRAGESVRVILQSRPQPN